MALTSFHCSNAQGNLFDARVAEIDNLFEARDYAKAVARSLMLTPNSRDWRSCCMHVLDDLGEEIFVLPLSSMVGRLH